MNMRFAGTSAPPEQEARDALLGRLADEFVAALERGEALSIDALANRHPDVADVIRRTFPALLTIRQLAGGHHSDVGNNAVDGRHTNLARGGEPFSVAQQTLGDFLIEREIGRGGMGIVYEAQQLSLVRRVALKIIPYATLLDPRRLQRFKNEAQAAASLQHPNIVSVFCVGCDRGIHYYAMELVRGQSMAHMIEQMRASRTQGIADEKPMKEFRSHETNGSTPVSDTTPIAGLSTQHSKCRRDYYRSICRLIIQIAHAVDYAHERGVIHRDLKPSNLLVDVNGKPWVTDFGLAQIQGDGGLTMTGDLLGTLRYMSPEQADGKKLLDHRSDIYSLGVTLYELLTLRPAHDGQNRQVILRQLEEGRLIMPRDLDGAIPKDLETIVLKATAGRAENRYDSAADLAADLQRFLDHRPIQARRISRASQLAHWIGRHRAIAALSLTVALIMLFLSIGGPLVAMKHAQLARDEVRARKLAEVARQDMQSLLNESLTSALQALENTPGANELHRDLLDDTLDQYTRLLQHAGDDPQVRFEVARAYTRLAYIGYFRFDPFDSQPLLQRAIDILERLIQDDSDQPEYHFQLGYAYRHSGCWLHNERGIERARKGVDVLEHLVAQFPDNPRYGKALDDGRNALGLALRKCGAIGDSTMQFIAEEKSRGERHRRYPDETIYLMDWIHSKICLASIYNAGARYVDAEQELREALKLCEPHDKYIQSHTRTQIGFAEALCRLGHAINCQGRPEEAESLLHESIRRLKDVLAGFPQSGWAKSSLDRAYVVLAQTLTAQDRFTDAESVLRTHLAALSADSFRKLGYSKYSLGQVLLWTGRHDTARQCFREALESLNSLPVGSDRAAYSFEATIRSMCPDPEFRNPERAVQCASVNGG